MGEGEEGTPQAEEGAKKKRRPRIDGFTPERRQKFLKTLKKTGCITDAAKVAGISRNTADRARRREPEFDRLCEVAREMAGSEIDVLAYDRAVHGVEEKVIRGGKVVQIKKKPSDAMLRMILQGSNPRKYGRQGAVGRKKLEEELRGKIEAEVREAMEKDGWIKPFPADMEAVRKRILRKLKGVQKRAIDAGRSIALPSGGSISMEDAAWLRAQPDVG